MKLFKGKNAEPRVLPELMFKRIPIAKQINELYEEAINKPKRGRKAKVS